MECIPKYSHFQSKPLINLKIFATIHSLMKNIILTDSCQTHCPCNTLRISNTFARSDTGVVIDNKPHFSRTCKTSLLFAPLAVRVHTGCSPVPFYTPTKPLIFTASNSNTGRTVGTPEPRSFHPEFWSFQWIHHHFCCFDGRLVETIIY